MASRRDVLRAQLALLPLLAACGSAAERPSLPTVAPPAVPSALAAPESSSAPTTIAEPASMVRLGPLGFGADPTYLAMSSDERFVATSIGMAGAEVEVFDAKATRVMTFHVDLERAVRALDFSRDGATLLVSLTGGKKQSAMLQWVSIPEGKVIRSIALGVDDASDIFRRGPEGHFLSDGTVVAVSAGKLLHWDAGDKAHDLADLPQGAWLSTSPDKHWLVVSTPDEVGVRAAAKIERVAAKKPRGVDDHSFPSPRAFVSNEGAFAYQDKGGVFVVDEHGASKSLGAGEPLALSALHVLVGARDRALVEIVDRQSTSRIPITAMRAWLSPRESTLYAHTGADADHAVSILPLSAVLDGSLVMLHSEPRSLAFSLDGKSVITEDGRDGVVEWDLATRKVRRRVALPKASDRGINGIFRSAHDVFVMAGDVHRLTDRGLETVGATYFNRPKAFVRKDGSTVVCVSDASEACQAHFILAKDHDGFKDIYWGFLFPLADGRGFATGPYASEGSDLGASRIVKHEGQTVLETTWLRKAELHWAVPAEDGGVILTWEGPEPTKRIVQLHRVRAGGIGPACSLGGARPTSSASMTLAPNGHTIAIPLNDPALLLVDVDLCTKTSVTLPVRAASVDFSPDGRSVAVGLVDRTVAVFPMPETP